MAYEFDLIIDETDQDVELELDEVNSDMDLDVDENIKIIKDPKEIKPLTVTKNGIHEGGMENGKQIGFSPVTVQINSVNALATKTVKELTLEDLHGATKIDHYFCHQCAQLERVEIPNTVTEIGSYAFRSCNLKAVAFEDNSQLTKIRNHAFCQAGDWRNVQPFHFKVPESVKSIGEWCFQESCITEISLPEGLETIDAGALQSCHHLTELVIPKSLKSTWGDRSFSSCTKVHTLKADFRNIQNCYGNSWGFTRYNAIKNVDVKNIRYNFYIYGDYPAKPTITLESLIGLARELIDMGASRVLSVGSGALAMLANVYVRPIEITDEMRAQDDLIDGKLPFEVCESTDEGACLITEYVTYKNWEIR